MADRLTLPKYWVDGAEVGQRLEDRWTRGWLLGWRDICRSTDQRTVIASLMPRAAVGHTTPLMFTEVAAQLIAAFYGNLCSLVLDYAARQKVGGTHLTYGYLKQLPILSPATYLSVPPCLRGESALPNAGNHGGTEPRRPTRGEALGGAGVGAARGADGGGLLARDWILPRVLELTYTAWDLQPFAQDCGYGGPPFRWDPERRALLRAELDALFFHLYGLGREDADYILETFPIVRKNDEKAHGEYRTKRLILERYDALAECARTGAPYSTVLDPPPADPRVAHPPKEEL